VSDYNFIDPDKIKRAIDAHFMTTGKMPDTVSLPWPEPFRMFGVNITIYTGNRMITSDSQNFCHHFEVQHDGNVKLREK